MNNRGPVNVDRISELPEALIIQILCLLPIKDAIATSVLSKQWQSHWKMLPKLKFDSIHHKIQLGDVCRSFLSHKAPVIQNFKLIVRLDGCNNAVDIGILIGLALNRNVRKLVLVVHFPKRFTFPTSLFRCETLETLKLRIWVIMDVPSIVCLKALRTLHLHCEDFKDDESVFNLLSGCPNLQNLKVKRYPSSRVKTFTISVPSLERLSIYDNHCGKQHYVIKAPSLKYLKIGGFNALESFLIENVPELVEAKIFHVSKIIDKKLLGSLTSVKRLSLDLSALKMKFPTGSIFNHLIYLELYTNKEAWWNLLTLMLGSTPKLQVLKLIDNKFWRTNLLAHDEWIRPKNVPECLLLHLETFMWEGYEWEREDESEVTKYILKNSNHLKRAIFSSSISICSEDRLVVVNDLKSVVKDTNSCHFQFK